MKEILIGFIICMLLGSTVYFLSEFTRKRLTFTTRFGQKIYDMGIPARVGYTLSRKQIEEAEDVFLIQASAVFGAENIKRFFSNNHIIYTHYPIPDISVPSGYANAQYRDNTVFLGLQPFVDRSGLIHEWMHDMLREKDGDSDILHRATPLWENGVVGKSNEILKKKRPN